MNVRVFEVPFEVGRSGHGTARGPRALLDAGVTRALGGRGAEVAVESIGLDEPAPHDIAAIFRLSRRLAERVRETVAAGSLPVVLAGDCLVSAGVLAGLAPAEVGVVWLDAHGDFNTPETTGSGYVAGMALAMIVGRCWRRLCAGLPGFRPVPEDRVLLAGARALDAPEAESLAGSAIAIVDGPRIRERGLRAALRPALERLAGRVRPAYLHIDLDVLDPDVAPANAFPAPGGLTVEELAEAVDLVGATLDVRAAALSAYDPSFDPDGRVVAAAEEVMSSLGRVRSSR